MASLVLDNLQQHLPQISHKHQLTQLRSICQRYHNRELLSPSQMKVCLLEGLITDI